MKIAVTGANGFVGSNLVSFLCGAGHEVRALVRSNADLSAIDPRAERCETDYCDSSSLNAALAGVDILIHNAGKTRTNSFEEMLQANVGITRRIVEASNRAVGMQRLVYISSQAASKPSPDAREVSEDEPSAPVTWYGQSKLLAEKIIRADARVSWTVVRPVSVYGEGDKDFLELFKLQNLGLNVRIGRQDKLMNLIHIGELCQFIQLCLSSKEAENQVFFASDGQVYSQAQFSELVSRLLGKPSRRITIPVPLARVVFTGGDLLGRLTGKPQVVNRQKMREILADNWLCSIEKARRLLGWNPLADLEGKLSATLDWYRNKGWL